MKKVNGKSYNDLSLYFRPENQREADAYEFLALLGRRKTAFVSELIVRYLHSVGIADVTRLSPEYAKLIASDSFMASTTPSAATTMSVEPLLKLFGEQLSQKTTSEPIEKTEKTSETKRIPPKRKSSKTVAEAETEKEVSTSTPIPKPVITEEPEDDDDLLDDDFVMDANIMQGLSAFGIRTN